MARYDEDHKEASRQEILERASERLRSDGIAAVGLRRLMADAGLTHGAFYAHFDSKADLVAEAVDHAVSQRFSYFEHELAGVPQDRKLDRLVEIYLHPRHREEMAVGCVASALAPEIARGDMALRQRFSDRNAMFLGLIADCLPAGGTPGQRADRATTVFATMLGTLQLARAEADPARAEAMLKAGRAATLVIARQPY
jgi:TetR/AcrR family transcriptional repressor of nem operon